MNGCNELAHLYGAYVYGDTSEEESQRIRKHLAVCDACRTDLERRESVLRAVPNVTPRLSPEDRQRIMWSVKAAVRTENKKPGFWQSMVPMVQSFSLAATLIVMFAGGTLFGIHIKQQMAKTSIPPPKSEHQASPASHPVKTQPADEPAAVVDPQPAPSPVTIETYPRAASNLLTSRSHIPSRVKEMDSSWRLLNWYDLQMEDDEPVSTNLQDESGDSEPANDQEIKGDPSTVQDNQEGPVLAIPDVPNSALQPNFASPDNLSAEDAEKTNRDGQLPDNP